MQYKFCNKIKEKKVLRDSFNELTRITFGFDFVDWYDKGHWGDEYIPHALIDNDKVISNISVNLVKFSMNGQMKKYIQLGTVMTHPEYTKKGLNGYLMNKILEMYSSEVDGIYLFANDSVLEYYPKFGFNTMDEFEYYMELSCSNLKGKYKINKVDITDLSQSSRIYSKIAGADLKEWTQNDSMYMFENLGLYQFWIDMEYSDNIYYLQDIDAYVIAYIEEKQLHVVQIIGKNKVDIEKLSLSFDKEIKSVKFEFTPANRKQYKSVVKKEEDCTLFVLGKDLLDIQIEKIAFPILSHA
jgi:GNAT superfamily N-acetyltransferase